MDELDKKKIFSETKHTEDKEILDNISHIEENNVILKEKTMKLTSVKDITDESLKTMSASVIAEFIEEEMKVAMGLMGVTSVSQLNSNYVCKADLVTMPHEMSSWVNKPVDRIL